MKKTLFSTIMLAVLTLSAYAQLPENYYARIDGKNGENLKTALHDVVYQHKSLGYGGLWAAYKDVDYMENSKNSAGYYQVFDYYSTEKHYFSSGTSAVSGMNREHVAPQSWWDGGTGALQGHDLFQVLPSESQANSAKGNYPLGVVKGSASYENPRMKTGHGADNKMVFEPCDEFKGDFARIYFYVAVVYPDAKWVSRSDVNVAFKKENYPTLKKEFQEMLLKWNADDPVSEWEMIRQERAYKKQGNRNPFVDYPDLANYIWNPQNGEMFDLATAELHVTDHYTEPDNPDPVDPDPDNPGPVNPDVQDGDMLFFEPFDDCTEGDNKSTGGSSKVWNGNSNFESVEVAYQAGGAVKLGTSSKTGSLQTREITFGGGTLIVEIDVKGWSSIEGTLNVSIPGSNSYQMEYTSTMSGNFETLRMVFENVPANPYIDISTSNKRCFIDEIRVMAAEQEPEIELATPVSQWQEQEITVDFVEGATLQNEFTTDSDGEVSYYSTDEEVATIDEDGVITIVGPGETTITAKTDETENYYESEASFVLTVEQGEIQNQIDPTSEWTEETVTVKFAEDVEVENEFTTDSDGEVVFTSSDEEVATVDENGVITVVGVGDAVITAKTAPTDAYFESEASFTLIVEAAEEPDGIEVREAWSVKSEANAIYTLTGQRVAHIEQPGIYIVNGRKVMVK